MRTFIHNFVKSVETDCKGCSVGRFHFKFVFIKSSLSLLNKDHGNVIQWKPALRLLR